MFIITSSVAIHRVCFRPRAWICYFGSIGRAWYPAPSQDSRRAHIHTKDCSTTQQRHTLFIRPIRTLHLRVIDMSTMKWNICGGRAPSRAVNWRLDGLLYATDFTRVPSQMTPSSYVGTFLRLPQVMLFRVSRIELFLSPTIQLLHLRTMLGREALLSRRPMTQSEEMHHDVEYDQQRDRRSTVRGQH